MIDAEVYTEYKKLRREGVGAKHAACIVRNRRLERVKRMMLGVPELITQRGSGMGLSTDWYNTDKGEAVDLTIGSRTFEIGVVYDEDAYYDDCDYKVEWQTAGSNEEQEGWGRDGRINGRYVVDTGRDAKVLILPADMDLLPLMKSLQGSKQVRFEEACRMQNKYADWACEEITNGTNRYQYYVKETTDGADDEKDWVGGYDDVVYAAEEAIASVIWTATH